MIMGFAIGALMMARLIVRLRTSHPQVASTGSNALDLLGKGAHAGLYLLVFAMAASGAATALQAGLPQMIFAGSAGSLPDSFAIYTPRVVHGWVAKRLMAPEPSTHAHLLWVPGRTQQPSAARPAPQICVSSPRITSSTTSSGSRSPSVTHVVWTSLGSRNRASWMRP